MKRGIICVWVLSMCSFLWVPSIVYSDTRVESEAAYRELLLELIETLQEQIALLQAELEVEQDKKGTASFITKQSPLQKAVDPVVIYQINQAIDVRAISNTLHREYFERVFEIFPAEYSDKLKQLEVFRGETAAFDSFVETLPPDHTKWLYAANEELFRQVDSALNTELVVHELAHMISYEEIIGVPKPAEITCHSYFDVYGCPAKNSYLGVFTQRFWSDEDLDKAGRLVDTERELETNYRQYTEDEFVSDYAALNPEEDFAESFVSFILDYPMEGGGAAQKIDFFSHYPKLLLIRDEVRAQL